MPVGDFFLDFLSKAWAESAPSPPPVWNRVNGIKVVWD